MTSPTPDRPPINSECRIEMTQNCQELCETKFYMKNICRNIYSFSFKSIHLWTRFPSKLKKHLILGHFGKQHCVLCCFHAINNLTYDFSLDMGLFFFFLFFSFPIYLTFALGARTNKNKRNIKNINRKHISHYVQEVIQIILAVFILI